jgi:TonB family protein
VTVCSILVALPLFSTGIVPVSARTVDSPIYKPMPTVDSKPPRNAGGSAQGSPLRHVPIVPISDGGRHIWRGNPTQPGDEPVAPPNISGVPSGPAFAFCATCAPTSRPGGPERSGPVRLSGGVSEGYLIHRVEPVYPHIAVVTGTGGEVRLHAIISKDGVIERLTLISGHPLLARAAMEAVQQWRYRPYLLNKEPVEVETFITVNFNPTR